MPKPNTLLAFGTSGQRLFPTQYGLFQYPVILFLQSCIWGAVEVIDNENDCCEDTEREYYIRAVVGVWRFETGVEA